MQRPATGHDHCTCHFPPHLSGTVPNPPNEKLVLPRLHPQEKMNRNARCWCLSGKKWKVCHRDRDKQTPINVFQLLDELRDEFAKGYCLHPDADPDTCAAIVNAHTIQKRGGLAAIAESNHVFSVKQGFSFLLSYRAICYEFFAKAAAIRATPIIQQSDRGRPFVDQCYCQDYLHTKLRGLEMGMQDLLRLRSRYCTLYSTSEYDKFHFYAVTFSDVLPVASCGAISPEYDFSGNSLQDILRSPQPIEQVAFNLTSFGDTSVAVFGWVDKNGPAEKLANSFRQLPLADKANSVVRFAFEYIENTMMRPSWWGTLGKLKQEQVIHHLAARFPEREFEHDRLAWSSTRQYQFVSSRVIDEMWSDLD